MGKGQENRSKELEMPADGTFPLPTISTYLRGNSVGQRHDRPALDFYVFPSHLSRVARSW